MVELKGEQFCGINFRANLKANCHKKRNCGTMLQANNSEKKQDSARLTAEQFWRTKYELEQWKMEKQSGAPVTTCIHEHICASCIYIVTRLQELQKVQLNKPSADYWYKKSRFNHHPRPAGLTKGGGKAMMGSRRKNKDNKRGREEWCMRRTT